MSQPDPHSIRLRPHHFLCMLTYVGKGYSAAFVENFDHLIVRMNEAIAQGDCQIEIIGGPDDVCAPRLCDPDDTACHCHDADILETDRLALRDLEKIPQIGKIDIGSKVRLTQELINTLRTCFKNDLIRTACRNCEWFDLCSDIAGTDFSEGKLK